MCPRDAVEDEWVSEPACMSQVDDLETKPGGSHIGEDDIGGFDVSMGKTDTMRLFQIGQ